MITSATLAVLAALLPSIRADIQGELPPSVSPSTLSALASSLLFDEPGDGRTWARGPSWKASFGTEGLTYIPFFGSDAPANYPVRLDLARVSVGSEPLELEERIRSREAHMVTLDRGSIREVYHVSQGGVEQTFVLPSWPGTGELSLHVDVESDLHPVIDELGAIEYSGSLGSVHYSSAVAVDALGQCVSLVTELTPTGFVIQVPAEFMAAASYPLTVDPVISTRSVWTGARRQLEVDVAHEGENQIYQIVFSEVQSALDQDVIAVSYRAPINTLFGPASIDISSASWGRPRNASSHEAQQFLCACVVGTSVGLRRVWGRTREAASGIRGPQFEISGAGAESVDVGGKGNDTPTIYDYMVVWQQADLINADFDIVAQAVNSNSTLVGTRIDVSPDPANMDRLPAISKSTGRPGTANSENEYMIVWEREISPTNHNIRAQAMEYTGVMSGHSGFNAYTFSDALDPDVSTASTVNGYGFQVRHWLVAFERRTGADYDIFAVVARDGFADNANSVTTMQDLDQELNHRDPQIAFNSRDFLVAYQTETPSGDYELHYTGMSVVRDHGEQRTAVVERRSTLSVSEGAPAHIAIASHFDGSAPMFGGEPGDAFVVWTEREASTGDTDVHGAGVLQIYPSSTAPQFCTAEVNSSGYKAWLRLSGSWHPANPIALQCEEMPINAFGHFLVSDQAGFVPNPGGSQGNLCLQGAVGRFNRVNEIQFSGAEGRIVLSTNPANLPSPSGSFSAQPGQTLYFQCWFRDVGSTSNFSNGAALSFD